MPLRIFRSFIAFSLEPDEKENLLEIQDYLHEQGLEFNWPEQDQLHVTVGFLGEIARKDMVHAAEIVQEIQEKGMKPLSVSVAKLIGFPKREKARVVAVQLGGNKIKNLVRYVGQVRTILQQNGVFYDPKPFVPHITLGRTKRMTDLSTVNQLVPEKFSLRLSDLGLYISWLTPEGAEYQRIV